jgi:hypothetical protein
VIDLSKPHLPLDRIHKIARAKHSMRIEQEKPGPVTIYLGDGRAMLPVRKPSAPRMPVPPCLMNDDTEAGRQRILCQEADDFLLACAK